MTQIEIIAVGRMKNTPYADLWDDYHKRLTTPWSVTLTELETRTQAEEIKALTEKLKPGGIIVGLDERGKALGSVDFAARMQGWFDTGRTPIQFIIGGADGLGDDLRKRADYLMSFGIQTWPHLMVRAMLIEQIYRARQINAGHPYHRA